MRLPLTSLALAAAVICAGHVSLAADTHDYRVLATSKTGTMEKEMNEAAGAGFRFGAVMGGDTAFGGREVVVVMTRPAGGAAAAYEYKLLATTKTSTMERELQEAADKGFAYLGQSVFKSLFGGEEVVVILERDTRAAVAAYEYRLLATSRTSTLEKELAQLGGEGYELVGMTVGKTALGGNEVVAILRRLK